VTHIYRQSVNQATADDTHVADGRGNVTHSRLHPTEVCDLTVVGVLMQSKNVTFHKLGQLSCYTHERQDPSGDSDLVLLLPYRTCIHNTVGHVLSHESHTDNQARLSSLYAAAY